MFLPIQNGLKREDTQTQTHTHTGKDHWVKCPSLAQKFKAERGRMGL